MNKPIFIATIVETQKDWVILNSNGVTHKRFHSLNKAAYYLADMEWVSTLEIPTTDRVLVEPSPERDEQLDTNMRKRFGKEPRNIDVSAGKNLCDFCSDPHPIWDYKCPSYATRGPEYSEKTRSIIALTSRGDWAACVRCAELIEARNWDGLSQRAALAIRVKSPVYRKLSDILPTVRYLHQTFCEQFSGERIPYVNKP
jgi:hypothetical protein